MRHCQLSINKKINLTSPTSPAGGMIFSFVLWGGMIFSGAMIFMHTQQMIHQASVEQLSWKYEIFLFLKFYICKLRIFTTSLGRKSSGKIMERNWSWLWSNQRFTRTLHCHDQYVPANGKFNISNLNFFRSLKQKKYCI